MAASEKEVKIKISGKVDNSLNAVSQKVDKAFSKITKTAKSAALAGGAAAAAAVTSSVKVGSSFESQMSTVEAISGATEKEIEQLSNKAKAIGATTKFTATQSGEAMEYMATAGWKTKQMLNGIDGIMDLAAGSGEDLATTSDIVTDALTAFNLKAKDAGHFSDILAQASSNSNTNVAKMGETFKYAASVAGALGYSAEDTATSIGLVANSGIKASQAGTTIRRIMSETAGGITLVSKAYAKAGEKTGKYKIETANADGSMKDWSQTVETLREQFSKMSEKERAMNAESIAGKTAMAGLLAIVNASEKDYKKLANSIDNASGAAKRMADIRMDNLEGDFTIFKSALEGKGIELYEEIKEPLRDIVQNVTEWLEEIDVARIVDDLENFGEAVLDFAEPLLEIGEWMLENPDAIAGPLAGIGSAIAGYKLMNTVSGLGNGIRMLGAAFTASPWIAGGALAIGTLTGLAVAATKAQEAAADASLDRHFGDIALSMDQIQDAADNIIGSKRLEAVSELLRSMKVSDGLLDDMNEAAKNIKKIDWKLSVGIDLSEDDMAGYEENVKEYVSTAQDLINEKGYSVTVATNLLFDDESTASDLIEDNNAFYKKMDKEAGQLSKKINKKLKKAMKDGLTVDLQEEINSLLSQMSEITNAMTEAENEASWEMLDTEFSGKDLDADSFERMQKKVDENIDKIDEGAQSAYNESVTNLLAQKKMGYISDEEYEKKKGEYEKAYYEARADAINQGSEFIYNTLMDTYGEDIANGTMSSSDWNALNSLVSSSGMSEKMQELNKQARANGYDLSGELTKYPAMLENINNASSGQWWMEKDKSLSIFGNVDASINKQSGITDAAQGELKKQARDWENNAGKGIDFSKAISAPAEKEAIFGGKQSGLFFAQKFKDALKTKIGEGLDANMPINITGTYSVSGNSKYSNTVKEKAKSYASPPILEKLPINNLPGHAEGIISNKAHIAAVSEGNRMEAIIPIDGSARSRRLYEATGKLMGYNKEKSQGVTFAPTVNITLTGSASAGDKEEIRKIVGKELDKQYKKMVRDTKRFDMHR